MPSTKENLKETLAGENQANQKKLANVNKTQSSRVLKHHNLLINIISMKLF